MLSNEESDFRKQVFLKWKRAAARLPLVVDTVLVGGRVDVQICDLGDQERKTMRRYTWLVNKQLPLSDNVRSILEWAWEECPTMTRTVAKLTVSPTTLKVLKRIGRDVETTEVWKIVQVSVKKDTLLVRCGDHQQLVRTKIPVIVLLHRINSEPDVVKRSELFFSKVSEIVVLGQEKEVDSSPNE